MKSVWDMNKAMLLVLIAGTGGCASHHATQSDRPIVWAEKVELNGLDNFFRVDEMLYRSAQPHTKQMRALQQSGIKTVLNLRLLKNDSFEARKTNLDLQHVSINTLKMSYDEILEALQIIENAEKPILIHCLHGSDRTGTVVAAYRMVKQGWAREEALREFRQGGFGYHEKWFPNLTHLLETLDVEKLKRDLAGEN